MGYQWLLQPDSYWQWYFMKMDTNSHFENHIFSTNDELLCEECT